MSNRPLVKICGVRSASLARAAVEAGADLIGIICHPDSRRYVDLVTAKEIAEVTRVMGGTPVAVFVDQSAAQMLEFCEMTGIDSVQLHGDRARSEQRVLPAHYQQIYVCPVGAMGLRPVDLMQLRECDVQRDYVLFDHDNPGSGQLFAWDRLEYTGPLRMGIAGGLNRDNVAQMLERFSPELVDISSGVEDLGGEKDINLIREFITVVRHPEALAAKDLPDLVEIPRYARNDVE